MAFLWGENGRIGSRAASKCKRKLDFAAIVYIINGNSSQSHYEVILRRLGIRAAGGGRPISPKNPRTVGHHEASDGV